MSIRYTRGVRLPMQKEPAFSQPIADLPTAGRVLLPISYGTETFADPIVRDYDAVTAGAILARPTEEGGIPVLSSVMGVVAGTKKTYHAVFGEMNCLAVDCLDAAVYDPFEHRATEDLSAEELREIARSAAIVDELDGVPLYRKLTDWSAQPVSVLVADAVESEPYGSSAAAVLSAYARQVKEGLLLAQRACGAQKVRIAVRLSSARRRTLRRQIGKGLLYPLRDGIYPLDTVYPSREKNGVVCRIGIQACYALFRAAGYTEPQISFVVTVAGDAVKKPQNVRVPIGTTADTVLQFCGLKTKPAALVYGDAMTGVVTEDGSQPLLAGITCLLALREAPTAKEKPCISCGRCAHVCHKGLLPYEIERRLDTMEYDALHGLHPWECDACGACSYVCPAGRDVLGRVLEASTQAGTVVWERGENDE